MDSRAFGLEHELALQFETEFSDVEVTDSDLGCGLQERMRINANAIRCNTGVWLPNGSRTYIDIGNFLEIADAECISPLDAVALAEANLLYAAKMGQQTSPIARFRHPESDEPDASGKIRVYHLNQDAKTGRSRGTHENYQVFKRQLMQTMLAKTHNNEDSLLKFLGREIMPFLVTRQIFAGNGGLRHDRNGKWFYTLSQRAYHMNLPFGLKTTEDQGRSIINLRDEPHSSDAYLRLHLICGDANMSQYARYLKLGVTSMAISLAEQGYIPRIELLDPVKSMHMQMFDLTGKRNIISLANQTKTSALDIQLRFCEAMHRLYAAHPNPVYYNVLSEYTKTLEELEHNNAIDMTHKFDHALKHFLLRKQITSRNRQLGCPESKALHIKYHEVGENSIFAKLVQKGHHLRVVDSDDVSRFYGRYAEPPETRAKARMNLAATTLNKRENMSINWNGVSAWNYVKIEDKLEKVDRINHFLPDPRNPGDME